MGNYVSSSFTSYPGTRPYIFASVYFLSTCEKKNQTRNYFPNMRRRKGKYEAAHTSTTWLGCRILEMRKNTPTNFLVHFVSKRILTSSRAPLWTSRAPPPAAIDPSGRRNTWRLKQGWANSGKIARWYTFIWFNSCSAFFANTALSKKIGRS